VGTKEEVLLRGNRNSFMAVFYLSLDLAISLDYPEIGSLVAACKEENNPIIGAG
jgi:hypothetical protein